MSDGTMSDGTMSDGTRNVHAVTTPTEPGKGEQAGSGDWQQ